MEEDLKGLLDVRFEVTLAREAFFLTAKVAVQQAIKSICL